jgi:chromosome segregation ATPase
MDTKNTVTLDLNTYDSYKGLERELKEAKELLEKKHVVTVSGFSRGPYIFNTKVYTDDEAVKILSKKLSENETEFKKNIIELEDTKSELEATKRKLEVTKTKLEETKREFKEKEGVIKEVEILKKTKFFRFLRFFKIL